MELWLIIPGCIIILLLMTIAGCYLSIKWYASRHLYDDAVSIPLCETALVLGTAKLTKKGHLNHYFQYRMDAAEKIFRRQKASVFIVSGASRGSVRGEEGEDMKSTLAAGGVPPDMIIADNYGYRTWDSLWRCRHTYGYNKIIVISQRFHTERAVFIGRRQGMDVMGFNAANVKGAIVFKMFLRECLARVKCVLDCYILHPRPVFMRKSMDTSSK